MELLIELLWVGKLEILVVFRLDERAGEELEIVETVVKLVMVDVETMTELIELPWLELGLVIGLLDVVLCPCPVLWLVELSEIETCVP